MLSGAKILQKFLQFSSFLSLVAPALGHIDSTEIIGLAYNW